MCAPYTRKVLHFRFDRADLYPHVELILGTGDRPVDLIEEGVDCAIRVGTLEDSTMIAREVGVFERVTVASPAYLDRYGTPDSLEDLFGQRAIHYIGGKFARAPMLDFVSDSASTHIRMITSVQVNDSHTYIELAKAGCGIIQPARFTVDRELAQGELVEILPGYPVPHRPISLIYPQSRYTSPKVNAFVSWTKNIFAASPMALSRYPR
jgi:LysR family transcriptional regulator for bpeEF and oprC